MVREKAKTDSNAKNRSFKRNFRLVWSSVYDNDDNDDDEHDNGDDDDGRSGI